MKKTFTVYRVSLILLMLLSQVANAQTNIWTGASGTAGTDWNTPGNWSSSAVPLNTDDVVIPAEPANQPVIGAGTWAVANSVQVRSGASLSIENEAVLTINGSATVLTNTLFTAFYNQGTVQNSGQLLIGNSPAATVGNYGLFNAGSFINNTDAIIQIDRSTSSGLFNRIGNSADAVNFTNAGTIVIGAVASAGVFGLENEAIFSNMAGGTIQIDRSTSIGLFGDDGTFTNSSTITIGAIASVGRIGLENEADFFNNEGGNITIDRATTNGLYNQFGSFTNAATITIGASQPVGVAALRSGTDFNNNACASLSLFGPLLNSFTFIQQGLLTVNTSQSHSNTGFVNDGVLLYPQGNPIPNVINNKLIGSPISTTCGTASPALQIGGGNNLVIGSIWYRDNLSTVVGSYDDNTFTVTNLTAGGPYPVYFTVTDPANGCTRTVSIPVTADIAPTAVISPTSTTLTCANPTATLTASGTGEALSYRWDDNSTDAIRTISSAGTYSVTVTDGSGCSVTAKVEVSGQSNIAPTIATLQVATNLQTINTAFAFSAQVSDGNSNLTTASIAWGDGSATSLTPAPEGGTLTATHPYSTPGVYRISLTLTDDCGATTTQTYEYAVAYDPTGGFVTGGGWIDSPAGAYSVEPALTGKANFGFVAKYQKGASVPTGNTEFQFKAGNLTFRSSEYDWLTVSGARAQFKGIGTINGTGSYGFMLTAVDGQINGGGNIDKFRIKIWDSASSAVVYDNKMGLEDNADISNDASTVIGGGSIVIHTPKGKNARESFEMEPTLTAETINLSNFPNPVEESTTIEFMLPMGGEYRLDIVDLRGNVVDQLLAGKAQAGELYQVPWNKGRTAAGLYMTHLVTERGIKAVKLLVR